MKRSKKGTGTPYVVYIELDSTFREAQAERPNTRDYPRCGEFKQTPDVPETVGMVIPQQ